jgi:hypothetical protein
MTAGYSGTPLPQKLGLKPGMRVALLTPPPGYRDSLAWPDNVIFLDETALQDCDWIQAFYTQRLDFEAQIAALRAAIRANGQIWISWPKKAAKIPTDLNENLIRDIGLASGLVDVKVAAIDAVWSGLKFVIPVKDRPTSSKGE